jgi:hypothetical protein
MEAIAERAERVLAQARELAARVGSREALGHAVFNPHDGLAVRAFPTLRERREFTMTKPYAEIYDLIRGPSVESDGAAGGMPRTWRESVADPENGRGRADEPHR